MSIFAPCQGQVTSAHLEGEANLGLGQTYITVVQLADGWSANARGFRGKLRGLWHLRAEPPILPLFLQSPPLRRAKLY